MAAAILFSLSLTLLLFPGCAPERTASPKANISPAPVAPVAMAAPPAIPPAVPPAVPDTVANKIRRQEQTRTECIAGRRLICGRVLAVYPDGLVVDSGYTDLLRPPLTQSWVVPGDVSVRRNPNILELREPGTPCVGLAFLTDVSKRRKVKKFDYVILMGYPAGEYLYSPAPNITKPIREFSAGLETAIRLQLKAETKDSGSHSAVKS